MEVSALPERAEAGAEEAAGVIILLRTPPARAEEEGAQAEQPRCQEGQEEPAAEAASGYSSSTRQASP